MNEADCRRQKVIDQELRKGGLRGRVNAMCASCIYDPYGGDGTWREQVEICTSYTCPLYDVRPVSRRSVVTPKRQHQRPRKGDCDNG